MTDRPIPMKAVEVRALLDGRKKQHRLVLKPQPLIAQTARLYPTAKIDWQIYGPDGLPVGNYRLPYRHGDRLWVREAWGHDAPDLETCRSRHEDALSGGISYGPYYMADGGWAENHTVTKRPSIHMPRWASRLTLTVTDVRVQRVQDISEDDARAEGVELDHPSYLTGLPKQPAGSRPTHHYSCYRLGFHHLWDSIHTDAEKQWAANPWVCAISFTVEKRNIDAPAHEGEG